MIDDAPCSQPGASFALLPVYGLEDLGLSGAARPELFYRTQHRPGADPDAKISVCHGVGGRFAALRRQHHVERAGVTVTILLAIAPPHAIEKAQRRDH
jgi:hypothetical protein